MVNGASFQKEPEKYPNSSRFQIHYIFPTEISRQQLEQRLAANVATFTDLQINFHQSSHRRTSDEQSGAPAVVLGMRLSFNFVNV